MLDDVCVLSHAAYPMHRQLHLQCASGCNGLEAQALRLRFQLLLRKSRSTAVRLSRGLDDHINVRILQTMISAIPLVWPLEPERKILLFLGLVWARSRRLLVRYRPSRMGSFQVSRSSFKLRGQEWPCELQTTLWMVYSGLDIRCCII